MEAAQFIEQLIYGEAVALLHLYLYLFLVAVLQSTPPPPSTEY